MDKLTSNIEERFSKRNWSLLLVFGLIGQIAWSVENMYFNLFVYDTISQNLSAVSLMVQLSGVVATVTTLIAGVLSDKLGNRRSFISWGYAIWGVTVALFGCISNELTASIFGVNITEAVTITLTLIIVGDCVMTLFGSTANDAAFNAWVTDNTRPSYRGSVEGVLAILPLIAMLIVAGGFGIIKDIVGYRALFIGLGVVISLSGIFGIFYMRDAEKLEKNGGMRDIFYGFKPGVVKSNKTLYLVLIAVLIYGVACQVFMPYLIIFMTAKLKFTAIEYSLVFGGAILLGAIINLFLGRFSDGKDKAKLLYVASGIFALGLVLMYLASSIKEKMTLVLLFGVAGFVMIVGFIFISALCGSLVRDYTPLDAVGKLQGVRMVFSVLIPMLLGPAIGNAVNRAQGLVLEDAGADAMTSQYVPAPEMFLVAAAIAVLIFVVIPLICRAREEKHQ